MRVLTTNANGLHDVLPIRSGQQVEIAQGLNVTYCRRVFRHTVSPMLAHLLPMYVRWADVVHLTAVYSFPTFPALLACKVLGKPMVWSPRGALQRWSGSRRRAIKAVWEKACRTMIPGSLILHVTSEDEATESQCRFPGVHCVVIPNGIDIPEIVRHVPNSERLRLLYLGRLHEKKGLENLLAACKLLLQTEWSLTIAGVGDPHYSKGLQEHICALNLSERVSMVGEVARDAKERVFEHADVVVVPSFTENFGIVVGEALAHGVPVIASTGTPWKCVEQVGCGLWVNNDPESLAKAISCMSHMPLRDMGRRGREWIQEEFSWDPIAWDMKRIYQGMLECSKAK